MGDGNREEDQKSKRSVVALVQGNEESPAFIGNSVSFEPLSAYGAALKTHGIDGLGNENDVNAVIGEDLFPLLEDTGRIVSVSGTISSLFQISLPVIDKEEEDAETEYRLIYDSRFPSAPSYAYAIKYKHVEDAGVRKRKVESTTLLNKDEVIYVARPTVGGSSVKMAVSACLSCIQDTDFVMSEAFYAEIGEMKKIKSLSEAIRFLHSFEKHFPRTEDNRKIWENHSSPLSNSQEIWSDPSYFEKNYTEVSLFGVTVGTLDSARALSNLLSPDLGERLRLSDKQADKELLKKREAIMRHLAGMSKRWEDSPPSLRSADTTIVGHDVSGTVIVTENSALKKKGNGHFYQELKESGELDIVNNARKVINAAMFNDLNSIVSPEGADTVVREVGDLAISLAKKLYSNKIAASVSSIVGRTPNIQILYNRSDENSQWRSSTYKDLMSLVNFAQKASMRALLSKEGVAENDFMQREKSRIRGLPLGALFGEDVLSFNRRKEEMLVIHANVPVLSAPVSSNTLRFKRLTTPVLSIVRDKESGEVKRINALASIVPHRRQSQVARVIGAIKRLDLGDNNYEATKRALLGRGKEEADGFTGFGLTGIKESHSEICGRISDFLDDLYMFIDGDRIDEARGLIDSLALSKNENLRHLSMYMRSVEDEYRMNLVLSRVRYTLSRKENVAEVLKSLNFDEYDFKNIEDVYLRNKIRDAKSVVEKALVAYDTGIREYSIPPVRFQYQGMQREVPLYKYSADRIFHRMGIAKKLSLLKKEKGSGKLIFSSPSQIDVSLNNFFRRSLDQDGENDQMILHEMEASASLGTKGKTLWGLVEEDISQNRENREVELEEKQDVVPGIEKNLGLVSEAETGFEEMDIFGPGATGEQSAKSANEIGVAVEEEPEVDLEPAVEEEPEPREEREPAAEEEPEVDLEPEVEEEQEVEPEAEAEPAVEEEPEPEPREEREPAVEEEQEAEAEAEELEVGLIDKVADDMLLYGFSTFSVGKIAIIAKIYGDSIEYGIYNAPLLVHPPYDPEEMGEEEYENLLSEYFLQSIVETITGSNKIKLIESLSGLITMIEHDDSEKAIEDAGREKPEVEEDSEIKEEPKSEQEAEAEPREEREPEVEEEPEVDLEPEVEEEQEVEPEAEAEPAVEEEPEPEPREEREPAVEEEQKTEDISFDMYSDDGGFIEESEHNLDPESMEIVTSSLFDWEDENDDSASHEDQPRENKRKKLTLRGKSDLGI